jgi:hypothetical protein
MGFTNLVSRGLSSDRESSRDECFSTAIFSLMPMKRIVPRKYLSPSPRACLETFFA